MPCPAGLVVLRIFGRASLACAVFCLAGVAVAANFVVNTTLDSADKNPGDGVCLDNNGKCSLRAAIMEANALPGADTILLSAAIYQITEAGQGDAPADDKTGDLDIRGDLTIKGAGKELSIIDGGGLDRVLDILDGARVNISGVTIRNGKTSWNGAGIRLSARAMLLLSSSLITKNRAIYSADGDESDGGGISVEADSALTVSDSAISGNQAVMGGGLSVGPNAHLTVMASVISVNSASAGGGLMASSLDLINSTVSGNKSAAIGGGLYTDGVVNIANSTISNNAARASGAGLFSSGPVTLRNSILAGNFLIPKADASNCYSVLIHSAGYNLIGNNLYCAFEASSSDIVGTPDAPIDPLLGPLADNGGPTFSHALLPNSPAIDAGNPASPGSGGGACEATDQRGVARLGRGRCDIGAFESAAPAATPTGTTNNSAGVGNPFAGATATPPTDPAAADGPRNPFLSEARTAQADTRQPSRDKSPEVSAHRKGPQEETVLAQAGEEETGALTSLTLRRDESGRPYYYISENSPDRTDAPHWFAMKNIQLDPDRLDKVTIVVGTAVSVIVGVAIYFRSLSLFGSFFSFPLWSPVDPVPVLMLATKERKRRRKLGQRDTEREDRDGRLGRLLDDDSHAT